MENDAAPPPGYAYACYRHPDRATALGCQRCGRPICPECVRPAPVGFQCPGCVAEHSQQVIRPAQVRGRSQFAAAPVTTALIVLNIAVWAAIMATGQGRSRLVDLLALQPAGYCAVRGRGYSGVSAAECTRAGHEYLPGVADGWVWQLLTSAFTHVSVVHIAFNMIALWFLGPQLERFLGKRLYVALYLLSALAGSVAVLWLAEPYTTTLGASGAVFGLMGALLIVAWRNGHDVTQLLVWLGANVAITFAAGEGISWQGHLGGLAGGLLVAWILMARPRDGGIARRTWTLLGGLGLLLLLLAAVRVLLLA